MFGRKGKDRKRPTGNALAERVARGDDRPTQPLPEPSGAPQRSTAHQEASAHREAMTSAPPSRHPEPSEPPTRDLSLEPETRLVQPPGPMDAGATVHETVGALLIIGGPGRGRLLGITAGDNPLGRAPGQRISLDFGDDRIGAEQHAVISFDAALGHFYLRSGDAPHVVYLHGKPLLEQARLTSGDRLLVGATELLFRPLIGDDFDWAEPTD